MEEMAVPPARPDSLEEVLHATAPSRALFCFPRRDPPSPLTDEIAHRAIGVVYRPERERWGNYVPTVLGERYDAFLWFDETRAVRPCTRPRSTPAKPRRSRPESDTFILGRRRAGAVGHGCRGDLRFPSG